MQFENIRKKTKTLSSNIKSSPQALAPLVHSTVLGCIVVLFLLFCGKFFSSESVWPDEALYLWCGKLIAAGPSQIFSKEVLDFHLPLFPLCLAPFAHSGFFLIAAKAIPSIFGVAGLLLLFYLGKSIASAVAGLCAAIALAFNYLFFSYSTRALTDVPVTTLFIFSAVCVYHAFKESPSQKRLWKIGLVLSVLSAIAFKWSAAVYLIVLLCYFGGRKYIEKDRSLQKNPFFKIFLALVGTVILLLAINIRVLGTAFPRLTAWEGEIFIKPWWYYLVYIPATLGWPALILLICGIWGIVRCNAHIRWIIFSWILAPLIVLSLAHEKNLRYALPLLPAVFLLCGIGAQRLLESLPKKMRRGREGTGIALLVIFFLCTFRQFADDRKIIETEIHRYIQYPEAGKWVSEKADDNTLIFASSPRALRLYTGINLYEYGGRIHSLPGTKERFEEAIRNGSSIILELDRWAFRNPSWIYPLNDAGISYLSGLGKISAHLIRTPYTTASEKKGQPVIFLIRVQKQSGT